ncbi:hypothetical protein V6B05_01375 [Lactococcus garvieae]|uniref:hypothetical protein n=1 Tax=Lactococcus garvieae TaxID=1363 RepID=UPI001F624A65|nr:hypothetical protein [Lactococcus garvieae]MCI3860078.1 hypothetical protein [Lactococcus garvieae]
MAKYLGAELHANGENINFTTPEDAKRLRGALVGNAFNATVGGDEVEVVISPNQCSFAVFALDEPNALGEKPECNNAFDCPPTDPEPNEE